MGESSSSTKLTPSWPAQCRARQLQAFADRDYFLVHKGNPGLGLFISKPIVSRLTQKWVLALSRRITNPDGSFGGVVASTLELSYVDKLFSTQELGKNRWNGSRQGANQRR